MQCVILVAAILSYSLSVSPFVTLVFQPPVSTSW